MRRSGRPSLAEKLKTLMASHRNANGRAHTVRSLSEAVKALPGDHASVSYGAVNKLANGTQENPTVRTIVALCEALGDVPPAHLLPHDAYSDLAALQAFEDPQARRILTLLDGMPRSALDDLAAELERRRADLGLGAVQPGDLAAEEGQSAPREPEQPPQRRRRRSVTETAEYAADSLEGL
ncbi:hypothetical protein OG613_47610 (plasmid) [Streptomyces sp. NBC_00015]|uniref:helix-turn-helix domain-containing protein n=1 Tax=Streptomyces sp. NBC_00015 TaxID=2903611 RepID=UPI003249165C